MITERVLPALFTDIDALYKTVSICKRTQIIKDGSVISESRDRRAFVPGQIEDVKTYLGVTDSPEINYLNDVWTSEVIENYQSLQQSQE